MGKESSRVKTWSEELKPACAAEAKIAISVCSWEIGSEEKHDRVHCGLDSSPEAKLKGGDTEQLERKCI